MGKARKDDGGGASAEDLALALESKRLRDLAVSRGLLARSKAHPPVPLLPTKTISKCNGKDIVKKGNRKTKYLFAFPGLVAPVAGGKFGELTHLDSRNPVLYIDFPHGRLKLFGTIVYPKNKYLTMHFAPGRGDIVCEDCFESLVVFPESWWIGTKEENPEETRLPLPSNLQPVKHKDFDFNAGAGRLGDPTTTPAVKASAVKNDPESPVRLIPADNTEEPGTPMETADEETVTLRQSVRNSGKKTRYAVSTSDSDEGTEETSDSSDYRRKASNRGTKKKAAAVKELVGTLIESSDEKLISDKGSKTVFKQGTLAGFLSKKTEVVQITDSPDASQRQKSGRKKTVKRITERRRQSITEISSDSEEDITPSDDSDR